MASSTQISRKKKVHDKKIVHKTESKKKMQIPISWFNLQGYCEYKLKLRYVDKIPLESNLAMKQGIEKHMGLDEKFDKIAIRPKESFETLLQKVAKGKADPFHTRKLIVASKNQGIYGVIDAAEFSEEGAVILDDKPGIRGDWIFLNIKHQIWAYCLAFQEQFGWKKPIVAAIRSTETQEYIYYEEYTKKQETAIRSIAKRIRDCFEGKREFEPTKKPSKCKKCGYKNICPKSLIKIDSKQKILTELFSQEKQ